MLSIWTGGIALGFFACPVLLANGVSIKSEAPELLEHVSILTIDCIVGAESRSSKSKSKVEHSFSPRRTGLAWHSQKETTQLILQQAFQVWAVSWVYPYH